jgi:hypothetical protein
MITSVIRNRTYSAPDGAQLTELEVLKLSCHMFKQIKYNRRMVEVDDILSLCTQAILECVKTYKPNMGRPISSWCLWAGQKRVWDLLKALSNQWRHNERDSKPVAVAGKWDCDDINDRHAKIDTYQDERTFARSLLEHIPNRKACLGVLTRLRGGLEGTKWSEVGRKIGMSKEGARLLVLDAVEMAMSPNIKEAKQKQLEKRNEYNKYQREKYKAARER